MMMNIANDKNDKTLKIKGPISVFLIIQIKKTLNIEI